MTDDSLFLIDVDKILRTKAPKHYKYIPKFVVSYLKKIVHQDEINVFLNESKDRLGVDFLEACMGFLDAKVDVKGIENLPKDGLYTFVSNHPLGGQDGVALGYVLGKHYEGKVKYLVNDLLMNLRGLAPLCIPINKTGKQAKDFPKMVEAGFQSDDQLIMFPAGLCSRRQNGVIRDLEWKKTFVVKSIQAKRDVIPVHLGAGILTSFTIWQMFVRHWALSLTLLCCILRMKCLRIATKLLLSLLANPYPGRLLINRKPLRSGLNM